MAVYTTTTLVKKILRDVDETIDLDTCIEMAHELVVEVCGDAGYTDARLEMIERWLAGHFYRVQDPSAQSESAGGINASYIGSAAMHLNLTKEGQQVLLFDTAGGFAALQKGVTSGRLNSPKVIWLGTEDE